jgi:NAD(P)H-flavin reductase
MLSILKDQFEDHKTQTIIKLFNINRTVDDIIMKEYLKRMEKENNNFEIINLITREEIKDLKNYKKGYLTKEILNEYGVYNEEDGCIKILICGPNEMTMKTKELFLSLNFKKENIHIF